jgi:site-specific recombinase XerC
LLEAPRSESPAAVRDRAILALMGRHGLRVAEVAGLKVSSVDLDAGTVRVTGKGHKTRTVYLTEASAAASHQWLDSGRVLPIQGSLACSSLWTGCTRAAG